MSAQPHTPCWHPGLVRGLLLVLLTTLIGGMAVVLAPPPTNAQAPPKVALPSRPAELLQETHVTSEADTFLTQPSSFRLPLSEEVVTLAFSPDGKKLATAGSTNGGPGQFKIWDVTAAKELIGIRRLIGVRSVAFSPDGRGIACGDFGGTIRVRDPNTGADLKRVRAHNSGVNCVAYAVDGKLLVSAGLDRTVKIWDAATLQEQKVYAGHTDMVLSAAFFPDGQTVVSGSADRTARIWDFNTGKERFTLSGHRAGVECVAVSPDGKTIATASWDRTIRLWEADTGKELGQLGGNENAVYGVAFSPVDANLLASCTASGTVSLWDVKTKILLRRLEPPSLTVVGGSLFGVSPALGLSLAASEMRFRRTSIHAGMVWAVAFSPDGKYLASASTDKTAKVWDVAASLKSGFARNVVTLNAAGPRATPVRALVTSPDSSVVALATDDRTIQIRDARTGDVMYVLTGHKEEVTCLAFIGDGQTLASGSLDGTVNVWDWPTGKVAHTFTGHVGGVFALAATADGEKLISGGEDGAIKVWNIEARKEQTTLKGHEGAVRALTLGPDNRTLASGGDDKTINVWDLSKEKQEPFQFKGHGGAVRALAFSSTGLLASGSADTTVQLWDVAKKKESHKLKRHFGEVTTLAFSPSGRTLVSGGQDRTIVVWDVGSGQARQVLMGHGEEVTALVFSQQGDTLLSGARDAIWRWQGADSAFPVRTLAGNPAGTRFAVFSPSGEWLASGGEGGNVTLWTRTLAPARYPSAIKGGSCWDVAFSPDGRTAALGVQNGVQLWDALTRQQRGLLYTGRVVRVVAFSPDGQYLAAAVGSNNPQETDLRSQIFLFNLATYQPLAVHEAPSNTTLALRFSPDSKTLATSGRDKTIQLWDVPECALRRTISENVTANGLIFLPDGTLTATCGNGSIRYYDVTTGQQAKLWQVGTGMGPVDISPDGTLLAAADASNQTPGLLKVWELSTGKEKWKLTGHSEHIRAVVFTRDGRGLIAVGGRQGAAGEISLWDLTNGRLRTSMKTGPQVLMNVAIGRDNRRVIAGSQNNYFLFDLEALQEERTWGAHGRTVTCGQFTANGNLVTGSEDGTLKVWDAAKGDLLATIRAHEDAIRAVALLPNGETMLSASDDGTVKRWDLNTFKEITTFRGHTLPVSSVAVSTDGKTAASGAVDPTNSGRGELILWDLDTGKPRTRVNGIDRGVLALDYSPDGTMLAAGLAKGTLKILDAKTGQVLTTVAAPEIRPLAFAPDGKFLATGTSIVTLWDPATWQMRATLQRHQGAINSVAYSSDGGTLASADQDGTIKLCTLSPLRSNAVGNVAPRPKMTIGDLEVRAAEPVVAVQPDNPIAVVRNDPPQTQQTAPAPVAPPKPKSLSWIPISEIVGLVLTVTLVFGLGVWMRVRQGRAGHVQQEEAVIDTPYEEEEPIIDEAIEEEEPPPPITFRCAACKKGLKVRAELAGKKVKCRQCGKIVQVPTPQKGGSEQITV